MNKSIKEQLEEMWCADVKPLDNVTHSEYGCSATLGFYPVGGDVNEVLPFKGIHQEMLDYWKENVEEPVLKPTESAYNQVESVDEPWMLENEDESLYDE